MNALTKATTTALGFSMSDGPDPFATAAKEMGGTRANFLAFSGDNGDYTYGPKDDKKELEHGTQLACNFGGSFKRGFICWKESEVVDEQMALVASGEVIAESDLKDHSPYEKYEDGSEDGWVEQASIEVRNLDTGELFLFKVTNSSSRRAMGGLAAEFGKVYRQKPNQVPVIEIDAVSFEPKLKGKDGKASNKKVGKKYAPVLKIVGWIPAEEFLALAEQGDAAAAAAEKGEEAPPPATTKATAEAENPANYEQAEAVVAEPVAKEDRVVVPPQADVPVAGRRAKRF
jgi:hypothetical protein